ncbi:MAG: homoserine kinase [Actinobacteria bacterium]|nr:homoserine kinase [Actinomycetota bacterium]
MRARAPASSANLGPGFDALAVALNLYVEVEVIAAHRLSVRSSGEGQDLAADASHLAAQVAIEVAGHDRLGISVHSQIPVGRGLGSSAALAVATAAAAGARDPLAVAAAVDGHPENAAASVLGGLVAATKVRGAAKAVSLPLDPGLAFVALVPDKPLPTAKARQALPVEVRHSDAAFNLGRMGLLVAGLGNRSLLSPEATEDRLHQDYRSPFCPEAPQLIRRLVSAGALAACWSGAGPTVIGICDVKDAARVRDAGEADMADMGVAGRALLLHVDTEGLVVSS